MKKALLPILLLLAVVSLAGAALAASTQLSFGGQPYHGRQHQGDDGVIWIDMGDFMQAMAISPAALTFTRNNDGVTHVTYNSNTFDVDHAIQWSDGVYVNARQLVRGMRGTWNYNVSRNSVDAVVPGVSHGEYIPPDPGTTTATPDLPAANPHDTTPDATRTLMGPPGYDEP